MKPSRFICNQCISGLTHLAKGMMQAFGVSFGFTAKRDHGIELDTRYNTEFNRRKLFF
jgi:hypothetical protein